MAVSAGGPQTLEELLEQQNPLPEVQLIPLFTQVLRDLEHHHSQAQLHLDVKPAKIIKAGDGSWELADYGITRLGSARYMAPERIERKAPDARSDVYSIGVVLYEAATGEPPFGAGLSHELLEAHRRGNPRLPITVNPNVSGELQRVIMTAMARNPEDRFQSAREFKEVLQRIKPKAAAPTAKPTDKPVVSRAKPEADRKQPILARKGSEVAAKRGLSTWHTATTPMSGKRPTPSGKEAHGKPRKRPAPTKQAGPRSKISPLLVAAPAGGVIAAVAILLIFVCRPPAVPDVAGRMRAEAEDLLAGAGFVLAVTGESDNPLPSGSVIRQEPDPGARARRGDTVRVQLSSGMMAVPEVAGLDVAAARSALATAGIGFGGIDSAYSDRQAVGVAVGTDPPAGARVRSGSEVTVVVASGRETCPECGRTRERGARFCTSCGYQFEI